MADARAHWEAVHEENVPEDTSWFTREPTTSLRFIRATGADAGARVIDVGAGARGVVPALLAAGYARVAALDVSKAALRRAQDALGPERAARVTWIRADVLEMDRPERFDVWHDRAVFHFLTDAADRVRYVDVLGRHLAPGGHVILATFAPEGPEQCSGLPVARYDAAGLAREMGDGFRLVEDAREEHVTPWGTGQAFTWARFERAD